MDNNNIIPEKDDNNKNNKPKTSSPLRVLFIVCILVSFWNFFIFPKIADNILPEPETETVVEPTIPEAPEEMIGNMEFIGNASRAVATSPVQFYYYRDIVTDAMFLVGHNYSSGHTVTQILNPTTGLPLTYSEYQAMEAAQAPPPEVAVYPLEEADT